MVSYPVIGQLQPAVELSFSLWQQTERGDVSLDSTHLLITDTLGNVLKDQMQVLDTAVVTLNYETVCWIRFSKAGLVGKTIEVDTRNVPDSLRPAHLTALKLDLRLFATSPGVEEDFVQVPIGFITYQLKLESTTQKPGFYPDELRSQNRMYEVEYQILEANKRLKKEARKRKKEKESEEKSETEKSPQ